MREYRAHEKLQQSGVIYPGPAECPGRSELYPSCPVHYRPIFTNLLVIDLPLRYEDGNIISATNTNVEFYWQINIFK